MSGLRLIAIVEALKGAIVLFAGLGILEYVHRHLAHIGNILLKYAGLGSHHLAGVTDQKIIWLAIGIVVYSTIRFAEAYGLWKERAWARWLGATSGGLYLPYEFYLLSHNFGWIKLGITITNILVVAYLALGLRRAK